MSKLTIASLASLAVLLALGASDVAAQSGDPFIATAEEGVVGVAEGSLLGFQDRGIWTYRGVPYAQAARFMAPEPPQPWEGVRVATNYGESCPIPEMEGVANDEQFNPHRYLPESEACQYLNIWTPGIDGNGDRPVMVWLHGGGFTNGSAIEQTAYDGRNLAEKGDVVVVTLNHRLNVLGTLNLSAYGERYAESANTGMADIVVALRWIRDNIEQFGGDPNNVTIFGQSGGGSKVRILMGIEGAHGLFDKAIVQSGASIGSAVMGQDLALRIAERTVQNLGLDERTIQRIEEVSYAELLAAAQQALDQVEQEGLTAEASFRPSIDSRLIPEDPVEAGWEKYARDIPLMIGNVLNENETIIREDPSELLADNKANWSAERTSQKMRERFGQDAGPIGAAWAEAYPELTPQDAYFFDPTRRQGVLYHAALKTRTGEAPVYSWVFAWQSPALDGIAGAWHCAEIPHVFANVELVPQATGGGDRAREMSHQVSQAWINFARQGDPNHSAIPAWAAYTPENGATIIFNDRSVVRHHHDRKIMDILYGGSAD